jgi:cytochrome c-type biogenesis protein CcmE
VAPRAKNDIIRESAMNPKKRRRLLFALAILVAAAGGTALVLTALSDNVLYFYSPSDVFAKHIAPGTHFRIGGLVEPKSLTHGRGADVRFVVTDGKAKVPIEFRGVLPALFREGQGVVALGALDESGTFAASEVLAKHDERYMPPEVVDALKRSGRWKEGQ